MDENSLFYEELMEVYNVLREEKEECLVIVEFWDCNFYVLYYMGYVMFVMKKIMLGGYWIGIVKLVCEKK